MGQHFHVTHLTKKWHLIILVAVISLLCLVTIVYASGFSLTRSTIDNGGGTFSNGGYTLTGIIGQPEALGMLNNSGYTLIGGVFAGGDRPQQIYLPIILKIL